MESNFQKVKDYLIELDYAIVQENEEDEVFVVENEAAGIKNLVIACADPILIMEQYLFEIQNVDKQVFVSLLQKNRDIIHGAFVLDESGQRVIFRDTLQLENLDLNELEGSLNSLELLLSEYSEELIKFSKN
ncbi:MAG: molecular chaperone Tir [Candidatus Cyclobacteriaceae bacterium M3_2C_046]